MQESRAASTLELVVNEQQLQNMSQIDLSRSDDGNPRPSNQSQQQTRSGFKLRQFKEWPTRFKESLSAKLEEAKSKSSSKTGFVLQVIQAFSGIAIWVMCFLCTIIIPVFLLFIGLFNLDNCQERPSLPYLIFATGFTMSASNLFNLAISLDVPILTNHSILTNDTKNTIASIINIMFNCVVTFLYILSAYMVYNINPKSRSTESNSDENAQEDSIDYCGPTLYNFSFWFITLTLSFMCILAVTGGIFFIYNKYRLAIIRGSTPRSHQQTNEISTNPASAF